MTDFRHVDVSGRARRRGGSGEDGNNMMVSASRRMGVMIAAALGLLMHAGAAMGEPLAELTLSELEAAIADEVAGADPQRQQQIGEHLAQRYADDPPQDEQRWGLWLAVFEQGAAHVAGDAASRAEAGVHGDDAPGAPLPADAAAAMAEGLGGVMLPDDPAQWGDLAVERVFAVGPALIRLGEQQEAQRLYSAWVLGGEGYRQIDPEQRRALCFALSQAEVDGAGDARGAIASHLESAYLDDPQQVRAMGVDLWHDYTRLLDRDFGGAQRSRWADSLYAAFAADDAHLAELSDEQLSQLVFLLDRRLFDRERGRQVALRWHEVNLELGDELDVRGLVEQARALAAVGPDGAFARQRLIQRIEADHLGDADAVRRVGAGQWRSLARSLGDDLGEAQRQQWRDALRAVFAGDDAAVAGLGGGEIGALVGALETLGDADSASLMVQWMQLSDAWRQKPPRRLAAFSRELRGEGFEAARQRLIEHIEAAYLPDPAGGEGLEPGHWRQWSRVVGGSLDEQQRIQWREQIAAGYDTALEQLDLGELGTVRSTLGELGDDGGLAEQMLLGWVDRSDRWRELGGGDLARVAAGLERAGSQGHSARDAVIGHLDEQLGDANIPIGPQAWDELTRSLADRLDGDRRSQWARGLRQGYAADEAMGQMAAGEAAALGSAVERLERGEGRKLASAWVNQTGPEQWLQQSRGALIRLAAMSVRDRSDRRDRERLEQLDATLHELDEADSFALDHLEAAARVWLGMGGDMARARAWAGKAMVRTVGSDEAPRTPGLHSVGRLAHLLNDTLTIDREQGHMAYAAALASLAAEDNLWTGVYGRLSSTGWQRRKLAYPLGDEASRDLLREHLFDAEGHMRVEVARILGRAYRFSGKLDQWRQEVEQRLEAGDGDSRAWWWVVKADVRAIALQPYDYRRGFEALDQAWLSAESEPVRRQVLRHRAMHHHLSSTHGWGIDLLQSVQGQFEAEASRDMVGRLIDQLERDRQRRRERQVQRQAEHRRTMLQSRLQRYEAQLERAQDRGLHDAVGRLQERIDRVEAELAEIE